MVAADRLSSLKVQFTKFIGLGQVVGLRIVSRTADAMKIVVEADGFTVISVVLNFNGGKAEGIGDLSVRDNGFPVMDEAIDHDFEQLAGIGGWLDAPRDANALAQDMFPGLCALLGSEFVTSTALTSTIVGMITPGLHSIFSSLSLKLRPRRDLPHALGFDTTSHDERFRLVKVAFQAPDFHGDLAAFVRYPPIASPTIASLRERVDPAVFAGQVALIIGGSRGIGSVIAKLIAAGGGQAMVTYASDFDAAIKVQSDIHSSGKGPCAVAQYDVSSLDHIYNLGDTSRFTHVYYCATSRISANESDVYDRENFLKYISVYVDGFKQLMLNLLDARSADSPLWVLYPSTIFVESRPKHMTEYAMAKAAGELLCQDIMKARSNLLIKAPRLPRILTDQTAVVPPVGKLAQPVDIFLPLLLENQ